MKNHVCPNCGHDEFVAHQVCHLDVIVDGKNNFLGNATEDAAGSIYASDAPFGPYTCNKCGAEFDELEDLDHFEKTQWYYKITDEHDVINCILRVSNWTENVEHYIRSICKEAAQDESVTRANYYFHLVDELKKQYGIDAQIIDDQFTTIKLG